MEEESDSAEVEYIVREAPGVDGTVYFLIKWKDFPVNDAEDSKDWKTREELMETCSELLRQYEQAENEPLSLQVKPKPASSTDPQRLTRSSRLATAPPPKHQRIQE
jgi:hypothetical protein